MKEREKSTTRIVKPLPRGQITIPAAFRERLGIDANTLLRLTVRGNKIEITPVAVAEKGEELREYSDAEVAEFLREDKIDAETAKAVRRLLGQGKL